MAAAGAGHASCSGARQRCKPQPPVYSTACVQRPKRRGLVGAAQCSRPCARGQRAGQVQCTPVAAALASPSRGANGSRPPDVDCTLEGTTTAWVTQNGRHLGAGPAAGDAAVPPFRRISNDSVGLHQRGRRDVAHGRVARPQHTPPAAPQARGALAARPKVRPPLGALRLFTSKTNNLFFRLLFADNQPTLRQRAVTCRG
jgi:hypothetical protein